MKFLPASEACIAYYPQAKNLYHQAEVAGCTKRAYIDGFAIIAEPHMQRVIVVQLVKTGFATHPRTGLFDVVRYDDSSWSSEPIRAYALSGGWAFDKDDKLQPLVNFKLLYPNVDTDNATMLIDTHGDPATGEFMAEQSSYGNFYAIDLNDPTNVITWKATPTRHGKLLYGVGPQISGVDGNFEVVGFTSRIYKGGRVYALGPKVNAATKTDGMTGERQENLYGIIMGCAFRDDGILAIVAYTKKTVDSQGREVFARLLSVWTTSGAPADGEVYSESNQAGWREWFTTPEGDNNLPWFISDDGKQAVSSEGRTLDMSDLTGISYSNHTPATGSRSIRVEVDSRDINWTFSHSDPQVLSEIQGSMGVAASGAIKRGGRSSSGSGVTKPGREIRGPKPDSCEGGALTYQGQPWSSDCPSGSTSDDPDPDAPCVDPASYPDGKTYTVTVTGTGALAGVTCSFTKFLPARSGVWVFGGGTLFYNGPSVAMTDPVQCGAGVVVSNTGAKIKVELWGAVGWSEVSSGCPGSSQGRPDFLGGLRNVTVTGSTSGTYPCQSTGKLESYSTTSYSAEAKSCEYTMTYSC